MTLKAQTLTHDFEKALEIGRPPNIVQLFPNSKALIVSGKAIKRTDAFNSDKGPAGDFED